MAKHRQDRTRVSWTLTGLLWLCGAMIAGGLVCAVLGFGGIVSGPIQIAGAKVQAAPLGVVLIVIGAAFALGLVRFWPKGKDGWGQPRAML